MDHFVHNFSVPSEQSFSALITRFIALLIASLFLFHTDTSACYANNGIHPNQPSLDQYQKTFRRTLITTTFNLITTNSITDNQSIRTFSTNDTNKPEKLSNVQTPNSIDEFRNREEQRELVNDQNIKNADATTTISHQQNDESSSKMKKIRNDILDAALLFVNVHGWSREAIANGAEQIGYPGIVHGMFPKGGIELINHFYMQCNERLMTQLNDELLSTNNKENLETQNTIETPLDMLKRALKLRLQMNEPYLSNWHQALAVMALPPNVPTSLAQLLTLVDDICHYAGDRSVDVCKCYI